MTKSGVYKILNNANGKIYVGSSVNIFNRIRAHKFDLKNNRHHSITLQRAWNLYGEDSFTFQVIEFIDDKTKLISEEQGWMNHFNSFNNENGYNISRTAGNCLGVKHSAERRLKVSLAGKGKNTWSKGRKLTPEHIAKVIAWRIANPNRKTTKGRKFTEEQKAKLRSIIRKPKTKEHIEKIRLAKIANGTNKKTDDVKAKISATLKKKYKDGYVHPLLGKTHPYYNLKVI